MGKTKPPYPEAFKQQIVELFHSGRSQSELAREFDVSAVSIANWVARAAADAGKPLSGKDVLTTSEREELVRLRREVKRLQTERDILGKGYGLVCRTKREDVHAVYALMQANQADLPIRTMARVLGVSSSGYHDWLNRRPSARDQANAELLLRIKAIHQMSDTTYGVPRMVAQLARDGVIVNKKRVERLMRQASLKGVSRRRGWCVTTRRDREAGLASDLVNRRFAADAPNQLWVADMTYLPTWSGFAYLAVVIDVYSRKVVGWAFGTRMTADLVVQALEMAAFTRKPQGVIHHSDQGSQYTSTVFGKRCEEMGVRPSMGSVGDAYDNAMAESFFASLECELVNRRSWKSQTEARHAVFTWIEGWYNPHRLHSALGYLAPNEFEQINAQSGQSPVENTTVTALNSSALNRP
ncbi:IS3 family transposase [Brachymonas sp. G13]|nr:IS3 family transposase [Brachymonas sp. J145]MEE1652690.1 IS3 family transposase [Brachymonas sp. J145]MEE1652691.1 IS3 family transposase [Brachymonas sp. J145]MEE1652991.1 IS3 family transposase [Brachymonas sp. J145]MEE1653444.1 IS3 family transposase [Brachymonas sp. J145]MEE1653597.1 IS3 family transposase [Brachymonas sp. J145]